MLGDSHICGNVHGERRLAHRRATSNHDHLARLKALGEFIEVGDTRTQAFHRNAVLVAIQALLKHLHMLGHDVADHLALAVASRCVQA
ncbi:hypothetical protein D3C79_1023180 [compost metagenome]